MWRADSDSLLQLHLPEGWPESAPADREFRYARFEGETCNAGSAVLAEVPPAQFVIAVAPASAAVLLRVPLPQVAPNRLDRLLPLAVEDAIASTPEEVHVVLVEHVPGGASLVAVVNRKWFSAVLRELAAQNIRPARVLIETELAERIRAEDHNDSWIVVLQASGGFALLGGSETIALDTGGGAENPPLALRIARGTRRRSGEVPCQVCVFTEPGIEAADLESWARILEVPVVSGGEWRPECIDGRPCRATDLLRGDFRLTWRARNILPTVKFAAIAAAGVLALHVLATVGDWWRLSSESRQLKSQMETQFRQIFPDARVVVDAPLQMRRGLARLRREAGATDASDFLPLLAAVAPLLHAAGVRAERMHYERGELELEITLAANEVPTLEKQLVAPGYRIRLERKSSGNAGNVALVRVAAEA